MQPLKITVENANEIIEDWKRREITAEARAYADEGKPPRMAFGMQESDSYWQKIVVSHIALLWWDTYWTRIKRNERKKEHG